VTAVNAAAAAVEVGVVVGVVVAAACAALVSGRGMSNLCVNRISVAVVGVFCFCSSPFIVTITFSSCPFFSPFLFVFSFLLLVLLLRL